MDYYINYRIIQIIRIVGVIESIGTMIIGIINNANKYYNRGKKK